MEKRKKEVLTVKDRTVSEINNSLSEK